MTPGPHRAAAAVARPDDGAAVEVAPGVLWVRMPLPFALDHINLWLLGDGDGWTLVDTGIGDDRTRAAWEALARDVLGRRPIRRVLCTHYHPDHVGLAGWVCERWRAELWCSQAEWLHARVYDLEPAADTERASARFARLAGVPEDALAGLIETARSYAAYVGPLPPVYRRLRDGAELRIGGVAWRVVVGRGHSPEHVCLYTPERRLLVAGDQVLPTISPNVSVEAIEPDGEPLSDFLDTLAALRRLPDDLLVLPSHGRPFSGLHRRLHELGEHHRQRLDEVLAACEEPRTAFEVMRAMFPRELDPHQTSFALGESVAHLNHLVASGLLSRRRAPGAPDRYLRVAAGETPSGRAHAGDGAAAARSLSVGRQPSGPRR